MGHHITGPYPPPYYLPAVSAHVTIRLMRRLPLFFLVVFSFAAQQTPAVDPKYAPLAERLFTAPDDASRTAIIASNRDLVTPDLVKSMNQLAGQVFDRQAFDQALGMYRVSCTVARQIGDKHGEA